MNQYHPKFLNKLPVRVQIHINRHIEYMIKRLEVELNKIPLTKVRKPQHKKRQPRSKPKSKHKKGQVWNKPKTNLMCQFEKETNKNAIHAGKITGNFEYWLWQRKKK